MHLLTIQIEEVAVRRVPTGVVFIWTVLSVAFRVTFALLGFVVGVVHAIAGAVCWVSLWMLFPRACLAVRLLRSRR